MCQNGWKDERRSDEVVPFSLRPQNELSDWNSSCCLQETWKTSDLQLSGAHFEKWPASCCAWCTAARMGPCLPCGSRNYVSLSGRFCPPYPTFVVGLIINRIKKILDVQVPVFLRYWKALVIFMTFSRIWKNPESIPTFWRLLQA